MNHISKQSAFAKQARKVVPLKGEFSELSSYSIHIAHFHSKLSPLN